MGTADNVIAFAVTWAVICGLTVSGLTLLGVYTYRAIVRTRKRPPR